MTLSKLLGLVISLCSLSVVAVASSPKDECGYPKEGVRLQLRGSAGQGPTKEACSRELVEKILATVPAFQSLHVDHKITGWVYDYFTADNGIHGWQDSSHWYRKDHYVCAIAYPNPHPPPRICRSFQVPVKIIFENRKEVGRTGGVKIIPYYEPKFELLDSDGKILAFGE